MLGSALRRLVPQRPLSCRVKGRRARALSVLPRLRPFVPSAKANLRKGLRAQQRPHLLQHVLPSSNGPVLPSCIDILNVCVACKDVAVQKDRQENGAHVPWSCIMAGSQMLST